MSVHFDADYGIAGASAFVPAQAVGPDRWSFRCPECGGSAFSAGSDLLCPTEGRRLSGRDGILTLMRSERIEALAPFLEIYRSVRRSEGWGGAVDYYRGLPFDSDGRHRAVWKIRARSYRAALHAIAAHFPGVKKADEWDKLALRVLELGAGNGWFSWRMAQAGHYVLATDISLDEEDGLGALSRYARPGPVLNDRLTRARAEMEELALEDRQFDLVVANGALHYAGDLVRAISEASRVLRPGGLFLVLDSPVYQDAQTGREMVRRRDREHRRKLGIESPFPTTGFLVEKEFVAILKRSGFRVERSQPFEGLARRMRRVYCGLRRIAPPARFPLFASEKL